MNNEYFELLKSWCDRLLSLQISEHTEAELYGGILCPACHRVHGRIDNVVYPFVLMTKLTGDESYLEAAKKTVDWCEHNMFRSDGSYYRDPFSSWNGITIFSAQGFARVLVNHIDVLDDETIEKWSDILRGQCRFIIKLFEESLPVTNYWAAGASVMALAYVYFKDETYLEYAHQYKDVALEYLSEDQLFYGEGIFTHDLSPKGCHPIDIAYNVEETIPALLSYADIVKDNELRLKLREVLHRHIHLMLPDGGWDNSFSYRMAKWTYWGSRTSDGAQSALIEFGKEESVFAEAAQRNFNLYKSCTQNGLLYGGPMYIEADQAACVHHTFCHAKAVADMVEADFKYEGRVALPREEDLGAVYLPSMDTYVISKMNWTATVTGYDYPIRNPNLYSSGGSLSLYWHALVGPIFAASMPVYEMTEVGNMQFPRYIDSLCQTPRIECMINSEWYTNLYDVECLVNHEDNGGTSTRIDVIGHLKNAKGQIGPRYNINYIFEDDLLTIEVGTAAKDAFFTAPIISSYDDIYELEDGKIKLQRKGGVITLRSTEDLKIQEIEDKRNFNPVGGFLTLPVTMELAANKTSKITVAVSANKD